MYRYTYKSIKYIQYTDRANDLNIIVSVSAFRVIKLSCRIIYRRARFVIYKFFNAAPRPYCGEIYGPAKARVIKIVKPRGCRVLNLKKSLVFAFGLTVVTNII